MSHENESMTKDVVCSKVGFGTYECVYTIRLPWFCKFPYEDNNKLEPKFVSVDKCLIHEVINLWEQGIKTTGCCCGHGNKELAFIGVKPEFIPQMKALGYRSVHNPCRPNDEDSFYPKTDIKYK